MVSTRQKRKAWVWFVIALASMLTFGGVAFLLLAMTAEKEPNERPPQPEAVILTNAAGTEVTYAINYYTSSETHSGISTYGTQDQATPINTRVITLNFHGSIPNAKLNWVIIVNNDAVMTQAIADQARGLVQVTQPGASVSASCPGLDGFAAAQVLSGQATLDQDGNASASVVGGVSPGVHYPRMGERTVVNVISVLPASPKNPSGRECEVTLNGWDQVNGELWRTPHLTGGVVRVGEVPVGSFVESANPPIGDPRRLSWQLQGPADISYTLFDSAQQGQHERRLFYAGAAVALAATLLVETVKAALQVAYSSEERSTASIRRSLSSHGEVRPPEAQRTKNTVGIVTVLVISSVVLRWLSERRPPMSNVDTLKTSGGKRSK